MMKNVHIKKGGSFIGKKIGRTVGKIVFIQNW